MNLNMENETNNVLITGGCGFIGHHVVEHIFTNTKWNIIIIDKLNYASFGFDRLRDTNLLNNDRVYVYTHDLINPISFGLNRELNKITNGKGLDMIIHMAAETHVDNSIKQPTEFIQNNVMSTVNILEYARICSNLKLFFYFSTDEVYGPALGGKLFKEDERHKPTNPYSASKSAAEQICMSYYNTYEIPVMRINVMNAFGERQHIEKFIPKVINKVLNDEVVQIHSYPDKKESGTRFYIHCRNIAAAVLFLLHKGKVGESYNVTGEREVSNLEMAQIIAQVIGKELKYEMVDFHSDRPGHDLRYGLCGDKMKKMGWKLPVSFTDSLKKTVQWTLNNKKWLEE